MRIPMKAKRLIKRLFKLDAIQIINTVPLRHLNVWQQAFCVWNAQRLGISVDQSEERFRESWGAIKDGLQGTDYRRFCDLSYKLYLPFFSDNTKEIYDSYSYFGLMHFLRMLSYPVPTWPPDHPIIKNLESRKSLVVADFGCGLAQASISLANVLRSQGKHVELFLADIPTLRLEFLEWFCRQQKIPCAIAQCTNEHPIPDFPQSNVVIAREVLEHLHEPLPYIDRINEALVSGGYLMGNVNDHQAEYMHVTPDLSQVRKRLIELNYREITPSRLFMKP